MDNNNNNNNNNSNSFEFTNNAWESIYNVVDGGYFQDNEADVIFNELKKNMRIIPFGEYLKRYIYQRENLQDPYDQVDLKTYQKIITESFALTGTPKSFGSTTMKQSVLIKSWLTQQSVRRNTVLLLGFGLSMSAMDVSNLLRKGLREQGINAKNPFEVICWYCYRNNLGYQKFEELWSRFLEIDPTSIMMTSLLDDRTVNIRNSLLAIKDEDSLFAVVSKLKTEDNKIVFSVTARNCFDLLYNESRRLIAAMYNADIDNKKPFTMEDIGPGDIEHVIYSAVPMDKNGNMIPVKNSVLNEHFQGKRLSRQQIGEILAGNKEVSRFDLITLNFFIFSQRVEEFSTVNKRYDAFLESTNQILEECFLGNIYTANPYESFILMCILSEDPLVTYADVMELSYEK